MEELRLAIADEEYLFSGEKLTKEERYEMELQKKIYDIAMQRVNLTNTAEGAPIPENEYNAKKMDVLCQRYSAPDGQTDKNNNNLSPLKVVPNPTGSLQRAARRQHDLALERNELRMQLEMRERNYAACSRSNKKSTRSISPFARIDIDQFIQLQTADGNFRLNKQFCDLMGLPNEESTKKILESIPRFLNIHRTEEGVEERKTVLSLWATLLALQLIQFVISYQQQQQRQQEFVLWDLIVQKAKKWVAKCFSSTLPSFKIAIEQQQIDQLHSTAKQLIEELFSN